MRRPWTRDMDGELARRYVAGEEIDSIGAAMDRSPKAVSTRISTLGLLRRGTLRPGVPVNGNAAWVYKADANRG